MKITALLSILVVTFSSFFIATQLPQKAQALELSLDVSTERSPMHAYEMWYFDNDGDYGGWQTTNMLSDVSGGWLNMRSMPGSGVTNATLSLPNHPINMYMPDASKYLFLIIKAKKGSTLSNNSFSSSSQLARFTFTRDNGATSTPAYFTIPLNNRTQYLNLRIGDHTPIVVNNIRVEFLNVQPGTVINIDEIHALDRME